jgi:class 3 adenylate cyclase
MEDIAIWLTVARFGGFVAKYRGDGLLIYSAIPRPHGDDAERAVRTELDGRRALQRFGRSIADQALSFGNTMVSKGSAGRRLTPDPKVIA